MRVLHLTIRRQFFEEIAGGVKRCEYRDLKPYWTSRLEGKTFDEVHFRSGRTRNVPFMRVEFRGVRIGSWQGRPCYVIELGRVLEVKRGSQPSAGAAPSG